VGDRISARTGRKPGFGRLRGVGAAIACTERLIAIIAGAIYPGIAAINPLILTKTIMRLML
jgi:hypothetical protein